LQRDRMMGDRLSGSAHYLTEGEQTRKDSAANIEILRTKLSNYLEGAGNRFLGGLYSRFDRYAGRLDKWLDSVVGKEKVEGGVAAWLERVEHHEAGRLEAAKRRMRDAGQKARNPGE